MSETAIQRTIIAALKRVGVWVIRTQSSGRRGPRSIATGEPGMPDLYLPGLGHMEVKAEDGELSRDQLNWHARARSMGVRVETVRSAREAVCVAMEWRRAR